MTHNTGRARTLRWVENLRARDAARIWEGLRGVVSKHALARTLTHAGLVMTARDRPSALDDLTQELYLRLLVKDRFRHYLTAGLTDEEIEREIGQLELKNLITEELRRRVPESYRVARRIVVLLRSSRRFRRFDPDRPAGRSRSLSCQVYGLSEWPDGKATRDHEDMEGRVLTLPVRGRDTRAAGRAGVSQIVISNPELESLLASVLQAVDAPAEVRVLRRLVMSRLPVLDFYQVPLGRLRRGDLSSEGGGELVDWRQNPEEALLELELERKGSGEVERFLEGLAARVGGKAHQYERITAVLWHCYLSPRRKTQLEVAATIGVSDSLVSDYRGRIEEELRALAFTGLAEARAFEVGLRRRLESTRFAPSAKSPEASRETPRRRRAS